jgi:hypothetical protein
MTRVAVPVGVATAAWAGLVAGPLGRPLAVAAAVAVLAAAAWRPAATAAGCLVVGAVAVGDLTAPGGLDPLGLALAAALLTTYLVLVDAAPGRWWVGVAAAAVAIAATVLATHLPARAWMAPLGMAAAAATLVLIASWMRIR